MPTSSPPPSFSVILPVYNVSNFLPQCLDSLINQTKKDLEIICVNDGSTDNSLEILTHYVQKDSRIIVLSQENAGAGPAREKGFATAKGQYISFIDPDDWVPLDYIERLYNFFLKNTCNAVIFNRYICNEEGHVVGIENLEKIFASLGYDLKTKGYFTYKTVGIHYKIPANPINKAFSAEFLRKNNIKFGVGRPGQDQVFSMKAYLCADKICYCDQYLYYYRRQATSATAMVYDKTAVIDNMKLVKSVLIELNLYPLLEKDFRRYQLSHLVENYFGTSKSSRLKYRSMCQGVLSICDFCKFIFLVFRKQYISPFLEKILSLRSQYFDGKNHKVLTIFGFKIIFK